MSRLRQGIGPLAIALATWCAAGTLAVTSPDSASARVAALAPWWMAIFGFAAACAVPRFRDCPWTAMPAVLSIVPWLPIPMTPVLLIWTGPLAWAPIILSLALATGIAPVSGLFRRLNLFAPGDATVAAFVLAATLGGLSMWAADPRTPGGDEPHYLIITQSLLKDGDLDIGNNHARQDYSSFFQSYLPLDVQRRGLHGAAYSIHAPGVSVLVAPLFQFFGYTGARVMIVLLTSLGAMLIWRLSWRATDSPEAAWFAWAAVILTPTFAMGSFSVFPDGPALFAVSVGVLLLVRLSRGDRPALLPVTLTGISLAGLPWLHTRFSLVAGTLASAITLRLLTLNVSRRERVSRLVAFIFIPMLSAFLWLYFFKAHYGIWDPRAPYGPQDQRWSWIGPAILGLFFDGQFGVAAYAPAVAVVFVGFCMKPLTGSRRLLIEIGVIALVYLAAVTTVRMWWAGRPAAPGRFMVAMLPLLAVPLAVAWTRVSQATRALFAGLAGFGAIVTAIVLSVNHAYLALLNDRAAQTLWLEWLSPVANLSRVWPGFFWQEPWFPTHVLIVSSIAGGLWLLIKRKGLAPRVGATLWAVAVFTVVPPVSWAFTGARSVDPTSGQLAVVGAAGSGRRVVWIDAGHISAGETFAGRLTILPPEPGVKSQPAALAWPNVPAGRYTLRVRSTSAFPAKLQILIADSQARWREFTVPGTGDFSFPFVIPSNVSSIRIDGLRPSLTMELTAEQALKDAGLKILSAAQYPAADVVFLGDMIYAEADGFWVRGKRDAEFIVMPASGGPVNLVVRNGASPNQVAIESGTFQRLLVMSPGQEQELEIPAAGGTSPRIRIASADGFVPAEKNPGSADRRMLGVWVEIR